MASPKSPDTSLNTSKDQGVTAPGGHSAVGYSGQMAQATKAAGGAPGTSTAVPHKANEIFPPFDPSTFSAQLIWLGLAFGFLYYMMKRHLLPRITDAIDERENSIKRDLAEAEKLKGETDAALASYEKALADAKTNAGAIARSTRERLAAETDKERATVDAQLAAKIADAEKRIDSAKAKAMTSVNSVATDAVGAIVSKLTGQTAGADEISRAIAALKK